MQARIEGDICYVTGDIVEAFARKVTCEYPRISKEGYKYWNNQSSLDSGIFPRKE